MATSSFRLMFDFMSPRLRLITQILIALYVVAGPAAQLLSEHAHWQKDLPMVLLAALAVFVAGLASLACAMLSNEGPFCKSLWALLGILLATQGVYEWLSMEQVVGDEDGLVVALCVAASGTVYCLMRLEYLRDETKNILLAGMAGQALAAISDAGDGGLYVFNSLASASLSWIADLFDLVWTPAYAVVLVYVALELAIGRSRMLAMRNSAKERAIWILSNGKLGDLHQMKVLAAQLGWPTQIKQVRLRSRLRLNVKAIAPLLFAEEKSDDLRGRPPDLIITAEAPLTPVARWIKARSGNQTRLVHIGRPAGNAKDLDLVITSPQFQRPPNGDVLILQVPLTDATKSVLSPADWQIIRELGRFPRPITAVAVGGRSPPYPFTGKDAERFAERGRRFLEKTGGSLIVTTGPRTRPEIETGLRELFHVASYAYKWSESQGRENPYRAMLHAADQFIVTSDSVSMIADAVSTKKPVFVHELPQDYRLSDLLIMWLQRHRTETSSLRYVNPIFWLFWLGTLYVRADRGELVRELKDIGLVSEWPPLQGPDVVDGAARCKLEVENLFGEFSPGLSRPRNAAAD